MTLRKQNLLIKQHKQRTQSNPQLGLWSEPRSQLDSTERWGDGMQLPFLGGSLTLCLATSREMAAIEDGRLHLPLPPGATARQIQDAVEACLRQEAAVLISAELAKLAEPTGNKPPKWAFSFATQADWVQQHGDGSLRINWRIIELPRAELERIVAVAMAELTMQQATADLWGNHSSSS